MNSPLPEGRGPGCWGGLRDQRGALVADEPSSAFGVPGSRKLGSEIKT
jgi:hypothetical protein